MNVTLFWMTVSFVVVGVIMLLLQPVIDFHYSDFRIGKPQE